MIYLKVLTDLIVKKGKPIPLELVIFCAAVVFIVDAALFDVVCEIETRVGVETTSTLTGIGYFVYFEPFHTAM